MITNKDKALNALQKVKDSVVGVVSDVISAPKRMKEDNKSKKSSAEADNYKFVREHQGKPDEGNYTDPLFRARVNAIHDTFDREESKQKQIKALQKVGGEGTAKAANKGAKALEARVGENMTPAQTEKAYKVIRGK
jgi:hypothetical protein